MKVTVPVAVPPKEEVTLAVSSTSCRYDVCFNAEANAVEVAPLIVKVSVFVASELLAWSLLE
jgi:hypothetical protein